MNNPTKRTAYRILAKIYHTIPNRIRKRPLFRTISQSISKHFPHHSQLIYTREYYETHVEGAAIQSYPTISKTLLESFPVKTVIDFGSGTGAFLECLERHGIEAIGLEQSDAARKISRERGVTAIPFDIRHDKIPASFEKFDMATCFEVAEHIHEEFSDRLIRLLTESSNIIAFTAAPPGQGGYDHVNEQPKEWWISKFEKCGYEFLQEASLAHAKIWKEQGVQDWYHSNLMIFSRS